MKNASSAREMRPSFACSAAGSNFAQSIGVSVSETITETTIETATVTANSRNRSPTTPPIKKSGMKTAISEIEIDKMVKPISPAPSSAACNGDAPPSICLTMFSTITMASSTTKPTAIVSAIKDRLSRL